MSHSTERMKLVWETLKKNPNKTSLELAELTPSIKYGSVSSILSHLEKVGLVKTVALQKRHHIYAVIGEVYGMGIPVEELVSKPMFTEIEEIPPKTETKAEKKVDLSMLSLKEALEIYHELKKIFA